MSTPRWQDQGLTLETASAVAAFARVFVSSAGKMAVAGAAQASDGVCWLSSAEAADERRAMRPHTEGSTIMIASKAIAAGSPVYGAAAGKVTDAVGAAPEGIALTAAAADGDLIEVWPTGRAGGTLAFSHVVTAGEGSANTLTVDTGLGVALTHAVAQVRSSAGAERAGTTTTFGTGGDAGKVTVANANLDTADIVTLIVALAPVTI